MEGLFAIREGVRRGSRTSSWAACCLTFAPRHERGLLTLAAHGRTPILAAPSEYPTAFGGRKVRCKSQWKATLVSPNPCAPLQIYSLQHLPRLSFIPTRCSINACFIGQLNDHYPRREKKKIRFSIRMSTPALSAAFAAQGSSKANHLHSWQCPRDQSQLADGMRKEKSH